MSVFQALRALFLRWAVPGGRWLPWVGAGLLVLSAGFAEHSWIFARSQQRALATVTENVSTFAPGGGVRFSPRLRFRAMDGSLVTVQTHNTSNEVEFAAGEVVPVLYSAGHAECAILATPGREYRGAIVLGVLGVALFDAGLILRLVLRGRAQKTSLVSI